MAEREEGQVENNSYCMEDSFHARNVKDMNEKMGYHNMSDLANTKEAPVSMVGAKENRQDGPDMPGDNKFDYDKNRR